MFSFNRSNTNDVVDPSSFGNDIVTLKTSMIGMQKDMKKMMEMMSEVLQRVPESSSNNGGSAGNFGRTLTKLGGEKNDNSSSLSVPSRAVSMRRNNT